MQEAYDVVYFQTEGGQPSECLELSGMYKVTFGFWFKGIYSYHSDYLLLAPLMKFNVLTTTHMIFLNLSRMLSHIGFAFKIAVAVLRLLTASVRVFALRGETILTPLLYSLFRLSYLPALLVIIIVFVQMRESGRQLLLPAVSAGSTSAQFPGPWPAGESWRPAVPHFLAFSKNDPIAPYMLRHLQSVSIQLFALYSSI